MRVLADSAMYRVRRMLAHNPAIPLDLLEVVAATARLGPGLLPRIAAASQSETARLAGSRVAQLRMLLAERPDLPHGIVARLAADADAKVVKSIAPHSSLTVSQLSAMIAAHGARVAAFVARNPNCDVRLLDELATYAAQAPRVLRVIAEHPVVSTGLLLRCAADPRARPVAAANLKAVQLAVGSRCQGSPRPARMLMLMVAL